MKKMLLLLAAFMSLGYASYAQEEGEESRFINEIKITGEMEIRSQLNLDGTGYAGIDKAELSFEYRFTKYTGAVYVMRLGSDLEDGFGGNWSGNGMGTVGGAGIKTEKFYAYTDILAELNVNQVIGMGFKVGKIDDQSEYRVKHHALDFGFETGDGLRSDKLDDALNIRWDFPINAIKDYFPLNIWVIHDADFSRSNKDFSISVHLDSHGMTLADDMIAIDWNVYYNYRGSAKMNTSNVDTGLTDPDTGDPIIVTRNLALEKHTVGGSMGMSVNITDEIRVGFGFTIDYSTFTHAKEFSGSGVHAYNRELGMSARDLLETHRDQLSYGVGMRFGLPSFAFNLGYIGKVHMAGFPIATGNVLDNYFERHTLAMRFDIMPWEWVNFYMGMGFDLRDNATMTKAFSSNKIHGHERISIDVGTIFKPISHMSIYLGYFWGNMDNGSINDTHWGHDRSGTTAGYAKDKMGNHFYLKTKIAF
ncbi:hypothetical protein PVA45_03510 [Entomospira entomophila]|uniref:Alginate export domain-containing protein n=1 Tax=Entomospira entomophila TaxID=2719988 RepID=A0A968G8M4_9SPIO|nr:hypothetical protein [Entomospira entomophilus]NIZ40578.1 hypothetical protein [Entomospira entomophilus]WDI36136.1 hypothetical protein PVA45_03510 [Entomospira entomophilus]